LLIGMVRAVDPQMLQQSADGFTVDFAPLDGKESLTDKEILLLKLRYAVEGGDASAGLALELSAGEGRNISEALDGLNQSGKWPADVVALITGVQQRLLAIE
jgi:hypothetical protein